MAVAVLVLLVGFSPAILVELMRQWLNLSPEITNLFTGSYLELMAALLGM